MPRVTPRKERPRTKNLYIVIQEGGSSVEHYATSFDTNRKAEAARISHFRASYRATAPMPVAVRVFDNDKCYVAEPDMLRLLEWAAKREYDD